MTLTGSDLGDRYTYNCCGKKGCKNMGLKHGFRENVPRSELTEEEKQARREYRKKYEYPRLRKPAHTDITGWEEGYTSVKKFNKLREEEKEQLLENIKKQYEENAPAMINEFGGYAEAIEAKHTDLLQSVLRHLDYTSVSLPRKGRRFSSPEEMEMAIANWWERCLRTGMFPTKRGLALALGTTWSTIEKWAKGSQGEAYAQILQQVFEMMAEADEQMVLNGAVNPVIYIFRGKNYHGLSDKQESVITHTDGVKKTREELEAEYMASLPEADYEVKDE